MKVWSVAFFNFLVQILRDQCQQRLYFLPGFLLSYWERFPPLVVKVTYTYRRKIRKYKTQCNIKSPIIPLPRMTTVKSVITIIVLHDISKLC